MAVKLSTGVYVIKLFYVFFTSMLKLCCWRRKTLQSCIQYNDNQHNGTLHKFKKMLHSA
jgi:hypothetical protein